AAVPPPHRDAAPRTGEELMTARSPDAVLVRRIVLPLVVIAGLVILWDVAIRAFAIPPYVIPTPASVGHALVKERARLVENAIPTILESLGGFRSEEHTSELQSRFD